MTEIRIRENRQDVTEFWLELNENELVLVGDDGQKRKDILKLDKKTGELVRVKHASISGIRTGAEGRIWLEEFEDED